MRSAAVRITKTIARTNRWPILGATTICHQQQERCLFAHNPSCNARGNDILITTGVPSNGQESHPAIAVRYQSSAALLDDDTASSYPSKGQESHSAIAVRYQSSAALLDDDTTPSYDENTKIIPFLLADIGEGIAEVEILQWFVEPGDRVAQFDRVCEVQSDKATVEITSRFDGIVDSLNGQVGDMVSVGSPLLHIAVEGVDSVGGSTPTSAPSEQQSSEPAPLPTPKLHNINEQEDRLHIPQVASAFSEFPEYGTGDDEISKAAGKRHSSAKVLATPAVRKLGMEHNIDLSSIVGTGPKGRVLKADILKIIKAKEGPSVHVPSVGRDVEQVQQNISASQLATAGEDSIVPIRGYNRLMVKSMTESLQVPQMCYSDEVNMNALKVCREELKPLAATQGVKLSYLPFLIKAVSLAITEYPLLNSSINVDDFTLTYHASRNVGVAMDSPRGLVVPVIKNVQSLSILDIARELTRLQEAAKEGNLSEDDITGVTFSLSNIGAIGGTYMSPIVAPPQVAIGAVGKIQRLPRFVGDSDEVEGAYIMQISWGGDHRVVDGATMARFSNQWKAYLESPMTMTFAMK